MQHEQLQPTTTEKNNKNNNNYGKEMEEDW